MEPEYEQTDNCLEKEDGLPARGAGATRRDRELASKIRRSKIWRAGMTRAEVRFYSRLDPRDPDYLDIEEEQGEEPENEWVDNPEDDYIMTEPEPEPELRGEL